MFESVRTRFTNTFGDAHGVEVTMAPGRVNLIGEYTDFNDGFVFPMTVDRGAYLAMRPRRDQRVCIVSVRYEERIEYALDQMPKVVPGHWSCYVLGIIEELRKLNLVTGGFDVVIDGDLHLGAGLSSSAALEMATALALQGAFGFEMSRIDIATLCQRVEHQYANVLCGIMDQFASGLGRSDHALLLDCRSLTHVDIPLQLGDYRIVIMSSEVKRALASSAYNQRRQECEAGVALLKQYDPSVTALRDVTPDLFEAHATKLSSTIQQRCQHVITENQRTLDASAALLASDFHRFGELMTASHVSLRDNFEVSCDELDYLVELALGTEGVLGARMTGAGFGGCTISLAHKDSIDTLANQLSLYQARFNLTPGMFVLKTNLEAGVISP